MGKWMSAALVVASLVGCGLGAPPPRDPDGLPQKGAVLEAPSPVEVLRSRGVQLEGKGRPRVRENVRAAVTVTGVLAAEGKGMSVVVGQLGCGFSVNATGKAIISNGHARVTLNNRLPADSELSVILILDTDGDLKCTEVDQLWSGSLVTTQYDLDLALDLATLEPAENWMCFAATP